MNNFGDHFRRFEKADSYKNIWLVGEEINKKNIPKNKLSVTF